MINLRGKNDIKMLYHLLFFSISILMIMKIKIEIRNTLSYFFLNLKNARDRNVFPPKDFLNVNT